MAKIQQALNIIHQGGVIAYPTDTVYGLGCNPHDYDAVKKILWLKQRSESKGLILISDTLAKLIPYIQWHNLTTQQQVKLQHWPAQTTFLIPKSLLTPSWISGHFLTVAVRLCQHPVASMLCAQLDHPLVSTSANLSGQPTIYSWKKLQQVFSGQVDYLLPGKTGKNASHIIELITNKKIR